MPQCANCSKTQAKLNKGQLCKECYMMNHINEIADLDDLESQANQDNRYDSRVISPASNNVVTCDRENKLREISKAH